MRKQRNWIIIAVVLAWQAFIIALTTALYLKADSVWILVILAVVEVAFCFCMWPLIRFNREQAARMRALNSAMRCGND